MSFDVLKQSLLNSAAWGSDARVDLIETHISCVYLVGDKAYKVKKPVDLGFVDFSTLELRKRYCEEELRLNRRLAPDIYLRVACIGRTPESPILDEDGAPIEYAVEMRRFSQSELLVHLEQNGRLTCEHVERLARQVAAFHQQIPVATANAEFGLPDQVRRPIDENFSHLLHDRLPEGLRSRLERLKQWSEAEFQRRREWFERRKSAGKIRECHGDMHLGNMILHDGEIVIFDCIEFNDNLRWVDVLSEVAFCTMDLEDRGHPELAARFLNTYLEVTGDYEGLWVLPYYLCYRSMVRAKVTWLRLQQQPEGEREHLQHELESYVALAERYAFHRRSGLILMHGVSGTGKSFGGLKIVDAIGAIRVRSDVERKRLVAESRAHGQAGDELYSDAVTQQTYERLEQVALAGLQNNFVMLLDATFLKRATRERILSLTNVVPARMIMLSLTASIETLRQRIVNRRAEGVDVSDADLQILDDQLASQDPLSEAERAITLTVETDHPGCWVSALSEIRREFGRE